MIKENKNLLGLNIKWIFSEAFTNQLLSSYDVNNNQKFDPSEIIEVKKTLIDYIEPRNFLMQISFYDNEQSNKNLKFKVENSKMVYRDKQIIFDFKTDFFLKLLENRTIKIVFKDYEGFFDFRILESKKISLYDSLYLFPNINNYVAYYKVSSSLPPKEKTLKDIVPKISAAKDIKQNNFFSSLKKILAKYTDNIKDSLQNIQKGNTFKKLSILLGFSFLYGFFHALGPGHGKTLVTSYFLANGGNWYKALLFSFRIGIIHVVSAFVLVITSIYIIKTFVSKVLNDISVYTSYMSAVIIILIALYMLYKKFSSESHEHCCSCHSCASTKKDWGIAISAGMIPCAGTVVIFILTFTLGNYFIGILSALAMALGMGSVIFASSIFAQYLHVKITNNFNSVINIIEYLAIIFILILGITLLISPLQI
nr:DUF1007 family protein [Sulfurospirillum arcachonense]